jgi:hypothetical protein
MDKSLLINNADVSEELQPVVRRIQDYLRVCAARAAKHLTSPSANSKPESGSPEEAFVELYQAIGINSIKQRRALARVGAELAPLESRFKAGPNHFGALSKIDTSFARSLKFQVQGNLFDDIATIAPTLSTNLRAAGLMVSQLSNAGKSVEATQHMREAIKSLIRSKLSSAEAAPAASSTTSNATELRLNLIKVRCIDEMDAEITDFADDRIVMGGIGFDSTGQEHKVSQFTVGTFARSGSSINFNGTPRRFVSFDLTRNGQWPRAFNATLAMAEKDADGGFVEFLHAIWDAIDDTVIQALSTALSSLIGAAVIGTAVGAAIGANAALIGTVVGAVVGAAIGFISAWIFESLKDDIFDPVNVSIALGSIQAGFDGNGARRSPSLTTEFNRDGARYALKYQWVLQ